MLNQVSGVGEDATGIRKPRRDLSGITEAGETPAKKYCNTPPHRKQLYKGEVDLKTFEKCTQQSSHIIFYNGDITSVQLFREMQDRFPAISHWMIGRGLIADPFLPAMIKADNPNYPENRHEVFKAFHNRLFSSYEEALSGPKHLLIKMYSFWEYFIQSFPDTGKGLKKIKKAQNISSYRDAVNQIVKL